jgi:hypothetical protein
MDNIERKKITNFALSHCILCSTKGYPLYTQKLYYGRRNKSHRFKRPVEFFPYFPSSLAQSLYLTPMLFRHRDPGGASENFM